MVQLILQFLLQIRVVPLRRQQVLVPGGVGGDHEGLHRALHQRGAGGQAVHHKGEESHQRAAQKIRFPAARDQGFHSSLRAGDCASGLRRAPRRFARRLSRHVRPADGPLLPPAGKRVAGGRSLRADGLRRLLRVAGCVQPCPPGASDNQPHAAFRALLRLMRRLYAGVVILHAANLPVDFLSGLGQRLMDEPGGSLTRFLRLQAAPGGARDLHAPALSGTACAGL